MSAFLPGDEQQAAAPGATSPVTPTTPAPAAAAAPAAPAATTGPRAGTVIWGFLVIAVGVLLVVTSTGVRIDLELAAIVALATAGLALLGAALVGAVRRR